MSELKMVPITDEQAKVGQEVVKAGRGTGSYLSDLLGELPKHLLGFLAGDQIAVWRREHLEIIWHQANARLRERGIERPSTVPLKLLGPILGAAADENQGCAVLNSAVAWRAALDLSLILAMPGLN